MEFKLGSYLYAARILLPWQLLKCKQISALSNRDRTKTNESGLSSLSFLSRNECTSSAANVSKKFRRSLQQHSFLGYSAHSNQLGCGFAACSVVAARKPQLLQQYNYNVKGVPEGTVRVQLQL